MKKFVLGLLVGVSITAAGSAYADDITQSIIGKKIDGEFPIKVAGKQLETNAAVIEGTSYLPVRAIGEVLNMDVSFNADLGIELKEKGDTTVPKETQSPITPTNETGPTDEVLVDSTKPVEFQIQYLTDEIKSLEITLPIMKSKLTQNTNNSKIELEIEKSEKRLAAMKALLVQLQQ